METLLGSSVLLFKSQLPHDGELPAGDRRETIWLVDFEQERYGHTGAGWKRSLTPPTRALPRRIEDGASISNGWRRSA